MLQPPAPLHGQHVVARPCQRPNGAPGPAAPLRPSDHPATPAPEQPLMLNGSARRCRQVELQVIWCRPVLGALSLPMVRFSFLGGVTLMIEITSFCRYARECEISHFFISREIHCEVKCEMSWRFHCEITFPARTAYSCTRVVKFY